MAAVAVAKLDFLDSTMKQKERLRRNVKLVHRMQAKNENKKGEVNKSYFAGTKNYPNKGLPTKKKARQNTQQVKKQSSNEANKKDALKTCLKTVKAARVQLKELLIELEKQYHLDLDSYEAQSLEFLKIPDSQDVSIWFLVGHFKKYYVVVEQMIAENVINAEYCNSLRNARNQISQLMETLELTAILITGEISSENGHPSLPDELITSSSGSRRQNRDFLFAKEYRDILDTIEELLKNF